MFGDALTIDEGIELLHNFEDCLNGAASMAVEIHFEDETETSGTTSPEGFGDAKLGSDVAPGAPIEARALKIVLNEYQAKRLPVGYVSGMDVVFQVSQSLNLDGKKVVRIREFTPLEDGTKKYGNTYVLKAIPWPVSDLMSQLSLAFGNVCQGFICKSQS